MANSIKAAASLSRDAFDALAEGVLWQNALGEVVEANLAAQQMLGLSRDELLARCSLDACWQAVHEDGSLWLGADHPAMLALRTGQAQEAVLMGLIVSGQGQRWVSCHSMPVLAGPDGPITGVVTSFFDMTERRQAEAQRLHAVELQSADCHLLQVSQMQRQFLSNLSHELRTPLNAVLGFCQLLRAGAAAPGSDKHELYLGHIHTSSEKLLHLIDSLLSAADTEHTQLCRVHKPVQPTGCTTL